MTPIDSSRFISIMSSSFRHYADESWGPIYGPGGPRIHVSLGALPPLVPWRELAVAYEFVSLADALEFASDGSGMSLLRQFADDPEKFCGTRVPGRPRPPKGKGNGLDRAVLGAALVFLAEGVENEAIGAFAREAGENMIG
jgi:hypothetical protein